MRRTVLVTAAWLTWALSPAAANAAGALRKADAGPFAVATLKLEWQDPRRDRAVPVKLYLPATNAGVCPVIVFSHGLGGSRDGYEYLGRHWASHGYVSVHLQHPGSDDAVWRGNAQPMKSMQSAAADLQNAINRPLDVRFAVDELTRVNGEAGQLQGRLDLKRIGVAGHSFGAYTTLAVAGQGGARGAGPRPLADDRVKAAIAMSAPVPRRNLDTAYREIRIPIFHFTGTKDDSPIGETRPEDRRVPFDRIQGAEQYLVTFDGGDHMVFAGRSGLRGDRSKDDVFHALIRAGTTAFWDAYLKDDRIAKVWLAEGAFKTAMGNAGTFETKGLQPNSRTKPGP